MKRNAKSSNVTSGASYITHTIFAASIGEPPPSARITSGWNAFARASAFRTTASVGSALTSEIFHFHTNLLQDGGGFLGEAGSEQETISDDQAAVAAAQVLQRERQAAAAEVDRRRQLVPQHVF